MKKILDHWFYIVDNIEPWRIPNNYKEMKNVNNEIYIYKVMNNLSKNYYDSNMIGLKINNDPKKKLFLNDEHVFDKNNWTAGSELIFGLRVMLRSQRIFTPSPPRTHTINISDINILEDNLFAKGLFTRNRKRI